MVDRLVAPATALYSSLFSDSVSDGDELEAEDEAITICGTGGRAGGPFESGGEATLGAGGLGGGAEEGAGAGGSYNILKAIDPDMIRLNIYAASAHFELHLPLLQVAALL